MFLNLEVVQFSMYMFLQESFLSFGVLLSGQLSFPLFLLENLPGETARYIYIFVFIYWANQLAAIHIVSNEIVLFLFCHKNI